MTVTDIKAMFPKGLIPINYFNQHEAEIRAAAKVHFTNGYRVIYRGPRAYKGASMTRRADATGAVLYWR